MVMTMVCHGLGISNKTLVNMLLWCSKTQEGSYFTMDLHFFTTDHGWCGCSDYSWTVVTSAIAPVDASQGFTFDLYHLYFTLQFSGSKQIQFNVEKHFRMLNFTLVLSGTHFFSVRPSQCFSLYCQLLVNEGTALTNIKSFQRHGLPAL